MILAASRGTGTRFFSRAANLSEQRLKLSMAAIGGASQPCFFSEV
jgi:hypothetical protein